MSDIEDIKRKFDNYEISSNEIKAEDKIKIANMYKKEIEDIREDIKNIKNKISDYEKKIKKLAEDNK